MILSLRFAGRELRSGVAGFRILLACLALGVAALAAAGSTAEAFRQGLAAQARTILGGDLSASVQGRRFTPAERKAFAALGRVTDAVRVRAMAQGPSGERRLAEVRGVDGAYPLAGAVGLEGAADLRRALGDSAEGSGAAVETALLDRLRLKLGDTLKVGDAAFIVRAVLTSEPDRLGRGFALGPRVLVSRRALERSGLVEADSLFGETARIALPDARDPAPVIAALHKQLPKSGAELRGRNEAAAGLRKLIDQLEYFLGFVGLTSLLAGGLGVSTAVSSYLDSRRPGIAVLKALGAGAGLIRNTYLIQLACLSALGIAMGLAVGAAAPLILGQVVKGRLPVPALFAVYSGPLLRAALFGALTAAAFSLLPLARARATTPAALFRRDDGRRLSIGTETVGAAVAFAGLVGLTVLTAPTRTTAGVMVAGVSVAFALLWALGRTAAFGAGRLRRLVRGPGRIGLANLAGPRSAARTATPAIGLGVALLTTVMLVQGSLVRQVSEVAPNSAPALVFTQIPGERAAEFDRLLTPSLGPLTLDRYRRTAFATARITGLRGRPLDARRIAPEGRWAFDRDISVAAIGAAPPDAGVTAGRWWPADYAGPPLVVLDQEVARSAGLTPGDALTLSVLGRDLETRIAALRHVEWGGFGTSFALIIDPAALAGAGLRHVAIAKANRAQETETLRALGRDFPAVNVISVREQLEAATKLFDQLSLAVRGAAAVAGAAGVLVLIGALAATARARAKEAAVLKVLGAARREVLTAYTIEYLAVGLIAGAAGVVLGTAAAWPVVVKVFKFGWSVDWAALAVMLAGVGAFCALSGAIAATAALAHRPAPTLRAE